MDSPDDHVNFAVVLPGPSTFWALCDRCETLYASGDDDSERPPFPSENEAWTARVLEVLGWSESEAVAFADSES